MDGIEAVAGARVGLVTNNVGSMRRLQVLRSLWEVNRSLMRPATNFIDCEIATLARSGPLRHSRFVGGPARGCRREFHAGDLLIALQAIAPRSGGKIGRSRRKDANGLGGDGPFCAGLAEHW